MPRLRPARRPLAAAPLLALALAAACAREEEPAPLRVDLFARMDRARLEGLPAPAQPAASRTVLALGFDGDELPAHATGSASERGTRFDREPAALAALDPAGGLAGGALRLGPGAQDRRVFALVTPIAGLARVRVSARVRLAENPLAGEASTREVLRVLEHAEELDDPRRASIWGRRGAAVQRVSRRFDPSGWDRVELELVTQPSTRTLELQLLHRDGGSEAATTRFDELVVEEAPLDAAEVLAVVRQRYAPHDGREAATPWRLRLPLRAADVEQEEVRDALLLAPPATLSIPLRVPDAESAPRLRFQLGAPPEARDVGARLAVRFEDDAGERVELGALELDPRDDAARGRWLAARLELAPVAGRSGALVFAAEDVAGSEPGGLALLALATPRIEPAEEAPAALNVLLIGVDTLRADRMGAFGYARDNTPNLAALAAAGVRFQMARSQAPWTLPSFASILTSLYPSQHGAGRGGHDEWTGVDPTTTALAEVLARVGYETQGIVANGLISPRYGLDQGFAAYRSQWAMESAAGDAPRVAEFVRAHRTTPWLLFWHVMDPHLPYSTAEEFRERFTEPGYDGRFARGRRPYVPFEVLDPRPGRRWYTHEGPPPPPELDERDRRFVHEYYDAEIAEMDAAVGEVLAALKESGQWERTVVAFVADHGEGLGDHGHYHHGYTLYDDQVHVPMLLRVPGRDEGRVVEQPVAAIDLAPTILAALGLPIPDSFRGVDRLSGHSPRHDAYLIEYPTYDSSAQKAWVEGRFKYLHDPVFRTEALYDTQADPGEMVDVAAEHPEVVARARDELDAFRWSALQKGRFHLRITGQPGQRLALRVSTDDLFDANYACRPQRPEEDFALDLERRHLALETTLETERLELVFWCRGSELALELTLDGEPAPGGLRLGLDEERRALPASLPRAEIPVATREEVPWPGAGGAVLWLEAGIGDAPGVVPTPAEIELLQELGYTR